jgi:hypothetical protein
MSQSDPTPQVSTGQTAKEDPFPPLACLVRLAVIGILVLCIVVTFAYASMYQRKYDPAKTQPTNSTWLRPGRSPDGNRSESVPLWTRRGIGSDS